MILENRQLRVDLDKAQINRIGGVTYGTMIGSSLIFYTEILKEYKHDMITQDWIQEMLEMLDSDISNIDF